MHVHAGLPGTVCVLMTRASARTVLVLAFDGPASCWRPYALPHTLEERASRANGGRHTLAPFVTIGMDTAVKRVRKPHRHARTLRPFNDQGRVRHQSCGRRFQRRVSPRVRG